MHELSLSLSIIELVVNCAKKENIRHVTRVIVEIGAAAAVDPEALSFCFPVTAADTVADGAELVIKAIPLKARCGSCGQEYAPPSMISACPSCGAYAPAILDGRQMRVVAFEGE